MHVFGLWEEAGEAGEDGEKPHTHTGRMYQVHTERPRDPGIEPATLLLRDGGADHCNALLLP